MAKTVLVRDIPKEVMDFIQKEQSSIQEMRGSRPSQSLTIIMIIRNYMRCKKEKKDE